MGEAKPVGEAKDWQVSVDRLSCDGTQPEAQVQGLYPYSSN